MTIKEAIIFFANNLANKKILNSQFEVELLLCFLLQKEREFILSHQDEKISFMQKIKLSNLIKKRSKNYPLAYLVGEKSFYGYKFLVNKNVLIPRPETELIVKTALNISSELKNTCFVDIGTGSGCIIISLAKEVVSNPNYIYTKFFASDISKKALKIAVENKKLNKISQNLFFLQGDLLSPLLENKTFNNLSRNKESNFIITANLPYVPNKLYKTLTTIQKEPKKALVAGNDGLIYYRKLFRQIKESKISANIYVLCEIIDSQAEPITQDASKIFDSPKISIKKDLSNKNRLVIIQI